MAAPQDVTVWIGLDVDAMGAAIRRIDPSRPVQYEGPFFGNLHAPALPSPSPHRATPRRLKHLDKKMGTPPSTDGLSHLVSMLARAQDATVPP